MMIWAECKVMERITMQAIRGVFKRQKRRRKKTKSEVDTQTTVLNSPQMPPKMSKVTFLPLISEPVLWTSLSQNSLARDLFGSKNDLLGLSVIDEYGIASCTIAKFG